MTDKPDPIGRRAFQVGYLQQTAKNCAEQLERASTMGDWALVHTIATLLRAAPEESERASEERAALKEAEAGR